MDAKQLEAQESISSTQKQINVANSDKSKLQTRISDYSSLINQIERASTDQEDRNKNRNAIPNLLNQIMSIIPASVQLTSIEDTGDGHIEINAQSDKYEQLGYLVAKLKTEIILRNVESTAGQKDNNVVTIKIEGDLPI